MNNSVKLRFTFEDGFDRIEELNFEGDVINMTHGDRGTMLKMFQEYRKHKVKTIDELDELAFRDTFRVELV